MGVVVFFLVLVSLVYLIYRARAAARLRIEKAYPDELTKRNGCYCIDGLEIEADNPYTARVIADTIRSGRSVSGHWENDKFVVNTQEEPVLERKVGSDEAGC